MRYYNFLMISFFLFCTAFFLPTSCTSDQLIEMPPPAFCDTLQVSYTLQVKEIIDTNCAFSGCHVAGSSAPGNYANFGSLSPFLTEIEFERFVIDLRDDPELGMPPNWPTNPGPTDLTEEEFEIISCWVNRGYPEN